MHLLTNIHRSTCNRYEACNKIIIDYFFFARSKGKDHKRKAFQADDMEKRYDCDKRYHGLYMNCVEGILFGL